MNHRLNRWTKLLGLLVVCTLVMPIAMAGAAAQDDAAGKVLRVHQDVYPLILDPQVSSFSNEIAMMAMNYEGLTRLDENLQTAPAAAESWEPNEDLSVWTFTLREGLTYSDGSPLTAENFRYAVERACDPIVAGQYQAIVFEIEGCAEFAGLNPGVEEGTPVAVPAEQYEAARQALGVTVIDDRTIEFQLTNPAPYFPYIAGLWVMFPVKQELVEAGGEAWWQDPANHIGNGPFQVTQIEQDQLITFEANENYWNGRPILDGLEYVYVAESGVALEAYRAGDLDILTPDPSQLPAIQNDPELSQQLLNYPAAVTFGMFFNLTLEPFSEKAVREAFAYAFDRETYCAVVRNADCLPTLSWVPEGVPGAIQTDAYAFDVEAAQAALAASSYGGPEGLPEIRYYYNSNDPANTARAEFIAQMYLENLGVEIILEPTEGTALTGLQREPETYPQMVIAGWIGDYPDPQNWLSVYWTCDAFAQRYGYCNEELDALLAEADVLQDDAARVPLYEQAGQTLIDDLPIAFLYNTANIYLVSPQVSGYTTTTADSEWPGQWTSLLTVDVERTGE